MSIAASVSALTSGSAVWKKTRVPSADAPRNTAALVPLPPVGPCETTSVSVWLATAVDAASSDAQSASSNAANARFKSPFPSQRVASGPRRRLLAQGPLLQSQSI